MQYSVKQWRGRETIGIVEQWKSTEPLAMLSTEMQRIGTASIGFAEMCDSEGPGYGLWISPVRFPAVYPETEEEASAF